MTQQRWEALAALAASLVTLSIPVFIMLYPENQTEIEVLSTFVLGVIGVLAAFAASWTVVNVIKVRANERDSIAWRESESRYLRKDE